VRQATTTTTCLSGESLAASLTETTGPSESTSALQVEYAGGNYWLRSPRGHPSLLDCLALGADIRLLFDDLGGTSKPSTVKKS
jgi:hypothetical protein